MGRESGHRASALLWIVSLPNGRQSSLASGPLVSHGDGVERETRRAGRRARKVILDLPERKVEPTC